MTRIHTMVLLGVLLSIATGCGSKGLALVAKVADMTLLETNRNEIGAMELMASRLERIEIPSFGTVYVHREHKIYYMDLAAKLDALGKSKKPRQRIEDEQCAMARESLRNVPQPTHPRARSVEPMVRAFQKTACAPTEKRIVAAKKKKEWKIASARAKKGLGFPEGQAAFDKGDYAAAMMFWLPLAVYADHTRAQHNVALLFEQVKADDFLKPCSDYPAGADFDRKSCFIRPSAAEAERYRQDRYTTDPNRHVRRAAAIKWYTKAAAKGFADSQFALAGYYDDAEAMKWYLKAARQGHRDAQGQVGYQYSQGKGVPKDLAKAAVWFRRAAKQGDAQAAGNLAIVNRQIKQAKWDRERQKKIARMCPKGVSDFGKLLFANPYDVKGRCYNFTGSTAQILGRSIGLYKLTRDRNVYIDFGRNAAPSQFFNGYVKGVGVFTYTSRGAMMIVPSLVATDLPPVDFPARAAD